MLQNILQTEKCIIPKNNYYKNVKYIKLYMYVYKYIYKKINSSGWYYFFLVMHYWSVMLTTDQLFDKQNKKPAKINALSVCMIGVAAENSFIVWLVRCLNYLLYRHKDNNFNSTFVFYHVSLMQTLLTLQQQSEAITTRCTAAWNEKAYMAVWAWSMTSAMLSRSSACCFWK